MKWTWILALLALAAVAGAADTSTWGWTPGGTVAVDSEKVVAGAATRPTIDLPKDLARRLDGPTVLVYFSPTCHHCRDVAHELQALHTRLTASGRAKVLGIASGTSSEASIVEFKTTYGVTFDVVHDIDREIAAAMVARSTPSAMLVVPKTGRSVEVAELWYPYLPGYDTWVDARVGGDVWAVFTPDTYLGNNWCGTCHGQEHASWKLSHHSVAWQTLVDDGKHTDPACTSCHVTGAGQPTGWTPDDHHSPLVDVGCEACHGPGGPHDGTRTEAQTTCEGCHDAKHSIAFSVGKGLPHIDHYRAVGLSEADAKARRLALFNGTAPRELLAFPDGENVGSATCVSCHAAEHAWWSENAHARGMNSLRSEGADDPACVRCHATAERSGLPPDTVSGYRVFEGVGCESCHGPGAAHVAAGGGSDNIEGLGDDCPVCVIEAVCTSCHTAKWSPDWELTSRLEAIAHGG